MEATHLYDIIVVGCGAAGSAAIEAARQQSTKARILFVGEENRPAYKRTKISKNFANGFEPHEFSLQDQSWYAHNNIDTAFGYRVSAVDSDAHTLTFVSQPGERISRTVTWRKLILATGARPIFPPLPQEVRERCLHSHDIAKIEDLRTRVRALSKPEVAIVGDGVLGIEVAEQVSKLGAKVTVIGKGPYPLSPHLNGEAGTELATVLAENGVHIDRPAQPLQFSRKVQNNEEYIDIYSGDGVELCRADALVFCMGLSPRTEVAVLAGLDAGAAIRVDRWLRTSDPDIYACGDCAEHPDGRVTHLWRDAMRQGEVAGKNAAPAVAALDTEISPDSSEETEYIYQPFRLKCEVFDRYFFSIGRPAPAAIENYEVREYRDGTRYVCAYFVPQTLQLAGVVMYGDKERNKLYMQAVLDNLTEADFTQKAELQNHQLT